MPACNEEGNIERARQEIDEAFASIPYDYEVILVDNASTDRTGELAQEIGARDQRWKYVRFSRNYGAEASITTGMRLASGDAVINVFSDLQDPPSAIPAFIEKWEKGYEVVLGILEDRQDKVAIRGLAAKTAYHLINYCSDIELPPNATDFRLLDRKVVDAFNSLNERKRYVRGLMQWVGYKTCQVPYNRRPRQWGKSKAPFWWCFQFTLDAVTSFSTKPLKLFTIFGFVILLFSILATVFYVAGKFITNPPPGVTTTLVLLLWNLTVLSLGIGILGEYIGHIYREVKHRPLSIIDQTQNLSEEAVKRLQESLNR